MMKNETGRSMVEMLGVLAIIGVLSVAGIAGYTMAMNKYKANEILNTTSQAVILAKASNAGAGIDEATNAYALGLTAIPAGIANTTDIAIDTDYSVDLTNVDGGTSGGVCGGIRSAAPSGASAPYTISSCN